MFVLYFSGTSGSSSASGAIQCDEPKTYKELVIKYHQAQVSKKSIDVGKGAHVVRSTGSVISKYYSVSL